MALAVFAIELLLLLAGVAVRVASGRVAPRPGAANVLFSFVLFGSAEVGAIHGMCQSARAWLSGLAGR